MTVDAERYGLNHLHAFNPRMLRQILSTSVFTMMQHFVTMATFFFFFIVVEHLGERELAIANIVRSIYIVLFIPVNALATTTNTMVSNAIGAGNTILVLPVIRRIARLSFIAMLVYGSMFCLFTNPILSIYTNDADLIAGAAPSVYVIVGAVLICAVGNVAFNGVSGTGNTRPALMMELGTLVFYCLYIYIIGMEMKAPVHWCFTAEWLYFGLLLVFSVVYLVKGKWRGKNV
jgi:Na+-driven multidrug efflux pump